ncbi:hypothetical protein Csac_2593 [Caldicellulosiruptor saccharolyticus DSM 8903]|uniref:Helicase HerA central domain-containing protein n=2 Tax=Caldicellulosiruptor TaxID=44000 RepID=A4XMN0_CALS8|nr:MULTISPECIES: DUF87 domain-containing protein [Caldicellulosiruptor]ABP68165.1 hypothetical protein Csac_2593 [Caldicellulosiruptor saccharolyticus DSM 8903]
MENSLSNIIQQMSEKSIIVQEIESIVQNARFVGFAVDVTYSTLTVLTNDAWKERANGIPHNSFLFAASPNWLKPIFDNFSYHQLKVNVNSNEEPEIILLRVTEEYELPSKDIWLATKIDKFKSLETKELYDGVIFDELSRNEIQYAGLKCRVLGTFYFDEYGNLTFGSDLENYYGAKILYVYKPSTEGLENIVNFETRKKMQELSAENSINLSELVPFGYVRYTSTQRLQKKEGKSAQVYINPNDFLARRTALFGMTRTGKSNTVKILIKSIKEAAQKHGKKVAQVIFDVNGEYIYINPQDKGAISTDIDDCFILTFNPNINTNNNSIRSLQFDLFKDLGVTHELVVSLLRSQGLSASTDLEAFLGIDMYAYCNVDSNDYAGVNRANRIKALYKYILAKVLGINVTIPNPFGDFILNQLEGIEESLRKKTTFTIEEFEMILNEIHERRDTVVTSSRNKLYREDFETLLNFAVKKNSQGRPIAGYGHLRRIHLERFHLAGADTYFDEILKKIKNGETILIDMVYGSEEVRKLLSTKIATLIFSENQKLFTEAKEPPYVILYIEEAHNLIGKDMEPTEIWPRIAKEGAKYNIGLVYSTQEPSTISRNILANTENWFVTHLNNEDEIKTVIRYYDFADFKESIMVAKDKGFARVKTFSSNFVCPVQINLYQPSVTQSGREGAGG